MVSKKITLLLFLFLAFFEGLKANYLKNPSFEFQTNAWTLFGGEISSEQYRDGKAAFKVLNRESKWAGATQSVYLKSEVRTVYVSGWMKTNSVVPGTENFENARITIAFLNKFGDQVHGYPKKVGELIGDQPWTFFEHRFEIPTGVKEIQLFIGLGNCTGVAYFDDLVINGYDSLNRELPVGTPYVLSKRDLSDAYPKEKLREDFEFLKREIKKHPRVYKYTSQEEFDSLFQQVETQITDTMMVREFYRLCAPLVAKIGCLHSYLIDKRIDFIEQANLDIPIEIFFDGSSAFIVNAHHLTLPKGAEIISINGVDMKKMLPEFRSLVAADAFNGSYIRHSISTDFWGYYYSVYGLPSTYLLRLKLVDGTSAHIELSDNLWKTEPEQVVEEETLRYTLNRTNNLPYGILTIPNFFFYHQVDYFKSFVDSVMLDLEQNEIEHLIIDLRGNYGGDPHCSAYLLKYLMKNSFVYFQDTYHPDYAYLADTVSVFKNRYQGNLYILIDGGGASSTGHFCSFIKKYELGMMVGEELGSNYACTSNESTFALSNSGLTLVMARGYYATTAVNDFKPGIPPDISVPCTLESKIKGDDIMIEKCFEYFGH